MPRLNFSKELVMLEVADFQSRLLASSEVMHKLRDVSLCPTPRSSVASLEGVTLYRYLGDQDGEQILIVYALVNRPDMIDLESGRSLVESLLARGFDVYLIDWGYPSDSDYSLSLDDYVGGYIDYFVDIIRDGLGSEKINILGVCQGGTFSVCYAALNPEKVKRLITTITPINFETQFDSISHLFRNVDINLLMDGHINMHGDFLNAIFLSLKPYRLLQQKYVHFLENIDDFDASATFFRMEKWIFDSPSVAAKVFQEFSVEFYQKNSLFLGNLVINGHKVDTQKLTMPILNIYAANDHLVPPASSQGLRSIVPSENYTEREMPGGHIGIYVSTRAKTSVAGILAEWLTELGEAS
ncbi:MAG: class III poly(R)-hydroxyalkanoic acid synthase subunit PhaC [Gammaproteobacteria bacterium]|nr:class III poly(R)-hydroxyalkanoic acid synthase subunit PhaC [Gammaproteobacteria bacterium]